MDFFEDLLDFKDFINHLNILFYDKYYIIEKIKLIYITYLKIYMYKNYKDLLKMKLIHNFIKYTLNIEIIKIFEINNLNHELFVWSDFINNFDIHFIEKFTLILNNYVL
jgi:hypothetical protein